MTVTAETYEVGAIYHVPPATLLLERNIREARPDADLIESVTSVGVLQPIVAVTATGGLLVRAGHRRVLAAVEAGLDTVPVYVAGEDGTTNAAEVDRIIRQRDENTHRAGLTAGDELGVVEQLVMFGLSVEEISKQARIPKARVETSIDVAASKLAKKAADKYADLTLEQAAAVAEFESDTDTAKELLASALKDPLRFDHTLQRARDNRKQAEKKAATIAKLTAAGATVIDEPDHGSKVSRLSRLVDEAHKDITAASHKKCPGHVAWVSYWGDEIFGCADPTKNGHRDRYGDTSKKSADQMTEKERAAAKTARRLVIENNKAWASAETVRREWLAAYAKVKTPPKGAAAFIAVSISKDSTQFDYDSGPGALCAAWLGIKADAGRRFDLSKVVDGATEPRALVIALVHNFAIYEAHLAQQSWRADGRTSPAGRYLQFLASCGYQLSEVEEFAISKKTV